MSSRAPIKVLMVCLGNICRSPTAEGVLRKLLQAQGLDSAVLVDSAGTSDWHRGEAPDPRTILAAAARGYDLSLLRSRPVVAEDFLIHDHVLAMDGQNLRELERRCPAEQRSKLALLLSFGSNTVQHVPDPYDSTQDAFDLVLDLCENACTALVRHLVSQHGLQPLRSRA